MDQFAVCIGIPKTSLWRLFKDGQLKQHSSALKPLLTEKNKIERLNFCLSFLRNDGFFKDMYSYVHKDKKWFYIKCINQNYYLLPDKKTPKQFCKSKQFITKVMFMATVARPRYDPNKKALFNGKISI